MKLRAIKPVTQKSSLRAVITPIAPPEPAPEPPKESKPKRGNRKLGKDEYTPMFPPRRFLVKDTPSSRNPTLRVKQYLELKVQRFDDDAAMPNVFMQMYQESEMYTGYLKGKTVYFPLEMLYTVIEELESLSEECDKRKIQ